MGALERTGSTIKYYVNGSKSTSAATADAKFNNNEDGYVFNSWGQLYLPWVGLSTGLFAFIAGLMFGDEGEQPFKKQIVKFLIYVALTFCICTVMINTTGFYFYFKYIYVSKKFLAYAEEHFGGNSGYFIYLIYRLFINGQIWNSIANYALLFAFFPVLKKIPFLRLHDTAEE